MVIHLRLVLGCLTSVICPFTLPNFTNQLEFRKNSNTRHKRCIVIHHNIFTCITPHNELTKKGRFLLQYRSSFSIFLRNNIIDWHFSNQWVSTALVQRKLFGYIGKLFFFFLFILILVKCRDQHNILLFCFQLCSVTFKT